MSEYKDYRYKRITFREFENAVDTIIKDSFLDDVFSAARYELSKRTVILQLYAPHHKLTDIDDVWSADAEEILKNVHKSEQCKALLNAVECQLMHRLRGIESSTFSATDVTLAKLFKALTERIENNEVDIKTVDRFISAVENVNKPEFKANMVAALERETENVGSEEP